MFPTFSDLGSLWSLPVCRSSDCVDGVGWCSPREEPFIEEKERKQEQQLLERAEGGGI